MSEEAEPQWSWFANSALAVFNTRRNLPNARFGWVLDKILLPLAFVATLGSFGAEFLRWVMSLVLPVFAALINWTAGLIIIAHFVVTGYFLYDALFEQMDAYHHVSLGVAIFFSVLVGVSRIMAILSWAWMGYVKIRPPYYPCPPRVKLTMSTTPDVIAAVLRGEVVNRRLHTCQDCDGATRGLGDRVEHCVYTGEHLPLFHRYCHALWVPVWLPTIKPFLLFLLYLLIDALSTLAAGLSAAIVGEGSAWLSGGICVGFGLVVSLPLLFLVPGEWRSLAWQNLTQPERRRREWWMATKVNLGQRDEAWDFVQLAGSPWQLSGWENVCQALGESVWTWPIPSFEPRRVRLYGKWPGGLFDLPLNDLWRRFERGEDASHIGDVRRACPVFAVVGRRGLGRSSGVDVA